MLVLARRIGESVMIGDRIKVTVLSRRRNQIALGIEAPKSVAVHREEIFECIKSEVRRARDQAANSDDDPTTVLDLAKSVP